MTRSWFAETRWDPGIPYWVQASPRFSDKERAEDYRRVTAVSEWPEFRVTESDRPPNGDAEPRPRACPSCNRVVVYFDGGVARDEVCVSCFLRKQDGR